MSLKPLSKIHQRVTTKQEDRIFLEKTNALPPNTFWDDASTLYHKSIQAVELTHGQLSVFLTDLMNDPARVSLVADPATLVANITLLTRDIGEHVDRLNAIYAQHSTRSGGSTTPDEHMEVISINGKYHDAMQVYDTTVMPTVTHIFEQIGAIDELLAQNEKTRQAFEQAALQNPAVISDVDVKEVK